MVSGPNEFDLRVVRPEIVILALTIVSIFIEHGKQRRDLNGSRVRATESLS